MLRKTTIVSGLLVLLATVFGCSNGVSDEQNDAAVQSRSAVRRDYNPRQVLRRPIRPIVDPDIVSARECNLADNELVIGVEINGKARAYSINQLTGPQREIINDELGGTAIAATW